MSGETTVGSILGLLRLDITDFEAGIARAKALADSLDRKDVDVKVKADTAGAEAKLGAVDAAAKKTDHSVQHLDKSTQGMGRSARFLVGALLTVGPALIPLAAATVGLAAGFGTMGAAGVLAIVGINQEVKKGTPLGLAYTTMLGTLKGDLSTLGHTAAAGVLQPFQTAVADLQTRMPVLNTLIGEFSGVSGRTAGVLTGGLVAAFIALAPLSRDVSMYVYGLTQRFTQLMSGPGVVSFGDYVRSVFPHVMQQVESIVGAAIRLVAAFAPFGTGILTLIGAFATAINAIPVDVLSAIATSGLAIFLGFKTYGLLAMPIHQVGVAMSFMGASTEFAATAMRSLTIAATAVGALIAVATILYTAHSESVRNDQQAVNDLTDALIRSGGAIDDNTVREQANKLAKDGVLAAALAMGYALDDVTKASLGNAEASARVAAHTTALNDAWIEATGGVKGYEAAGIHAGSNIRLVTDATKDGVKQLDLAKAAYDAVNAATSTGAGATDSLTAAQQRSAAAQKVQADAIAATTKKMVDENDVAGLLKQSIEALSGKKMNSAEAQNAFEQSGMSLEKSVESNASGADSANASLANANTRVANAKRALSRAQGAKHPNASSIATAQANLASAQRGQARAATKAGDKNTDNATAGSLRGDSDNAIKNRGNLLSYVNRGIDAAGAAGDISGTKGGIKRMQELRAEIIKNATEWGFNKKEVTKFVDSVLTIPKKLPMAQLDIDTAAAAAKVKALLALISQLRGKTGDNHVATGLGGSGGQVVGSANGNIFNAYRSGGFENHVAQIGNGITRQWNEPETGGEAYIPLAASKRSRSMAIWQETGRRLGAQSETHTTTTNHYGDIIAADPNAYRAAMEREARQKALRAT